MAADVTTPSTLTAQNIRFENSGLMHLGEISVLTQERYFRWGRFKSTWELEEQEDYEYDARENLLLTTHRNNETGTLVNEWRRREVSNNAGVVTEYYDNIWTDGAWARSLHIVFSLALEGNYSDGIAYSWENSE